MSLHDIVSILLVLKVNRVKPTFLRILFGSGKIDLKIFSHIGNTYCTQAASISLAAFLLISLCVVQ